MTSRAKHRLRPEPTEVRRVRAAIDECGPERVAEEADVCEATVVRIAAGKGCHRLTLTSVLDACARLMPPTALYADVR